MAGLKLADNLPLPAELAGRRTAVFGISGSGKSNTATVLIENLLHAGEQVVLVDPKGEGWGLLSTAAGKPSNLPIVVFGEPNGHAGCCLLFLIAYEIRSMVQFDDRPRRADKENKA